MTIYNDKMSLASVYVPMPDGVRLAVDIWQPVNLAPADRLPAIFYFTRYWRSYGLVKDMLEVQPPYKTAAYFTARGCVLVVADGRGSGASFGTRAGEYSPAEIADIPHLLDWIARQPWCNGRIAPMGTSYTGNTAFISGTAQTDALKIIAANSVDFDAYSQLMCPGGIPNIWMKGSWGKMVGAMDRNDAKTLMDMASPPPPEEYAKNICGVRPVDVDMDGSLLRAAVAEHAGNFNVGADDIDLTYRNPTPEIAAMNRSASVSGYLRVLEEAGKPILYRTGWRDAGTAEGALSLFNSISNPMRIMLGPWDHGLNTLADPFHTGDVQPLSIEEKLSSIMEAIFPYLLGDDNLKNAEMRVIEYFTFGENKWKRTDQWPPARTTMRRLYLDSNHGLSASSPQIETGGDEYVVDREASTGIFNRWHTQLSAPIHSPDRREADSRLLVYDSAPLETDVEVTGHPLVRLFIRSNDTDAAVFAYLEDIAPDGAVKLITEGCLRGLHRQISKDAPPYWVPGPCHSFLKEDAQPMSPGEVAEFHFNLFPTSVLFKKGHSIRLAIAGADKDTFARVSEIEGQKWIVERNRAFASYLELPIVPTGE